MMDLFEAFNYGLQATNPSQGEWGIGQQQPKTRVYHPWERGRETSAFEMVPAPLVNRFPLSILPISKKTKFFQKIEKNFQKGIDKRKRKWYNTKAAQEWRKSGRKA